MFFGDWFLGKLCPVAGSAECCDYDFPASDELRLWACIVNKCATTKKISIFSLEIGLGRQFVVVRFLWHLHLVTHGSLWWPSGFLRIRVAYFSYHKRYYPRDFLGKGEHGEHTSRFVESLCTQLHTLQTLCAQRYSGSALWNFINIWNGLKWTIWTFLGVVR